MDFSKTACQNWLAQGFDLDGNGTATESDIDTTANGDIQQMGNGLTRSLPSLRTLSMPDEDATSGSIPTSEPDSEIESTTGTDASFDSCVLEERSHLNSAPKGDGSEDVLVQISFTSRFTVSEYPRPIRFGSRCGYISLNATYDELQAAVQFECASARRKEVDTMARLYKFGRGVRMESFITFTDERKVYANNNQWRKSRFASLKDLFPPEKQPLLPIEVNISIIPLKKESSPAVFPGLRDLEHGIDWKMNLISQLSILQQSDESNHEPMRLAMLAAVREGDITRPMIRRVPNRMINGILIGCPDAAVTLMEGEQTHPSAEGTNLAAYRDMNGEILNLSELPYGSPKDRALGPPQEPQMTFLDYQPSNTAASLPDGEIHLAIRVVDRFTGGQLFRLPANMLMVVHPGKGVVDAITHSLLEGLFRFACFSCEWRLQQFLMDSRVGGRWKIELWVLPQTGPENGKLGKLYQFKKGSLKWFLDPEVVKSGKGYPTLYMEAHIVPRSEDDRRQVNCLQLVWNRGIDANDDDDDDDDDDWKDEDDDDSD